MSASPELKRKMMRLVKETAPDFEKLSDSVWTAVITLVADEAFNAGMTRAAEVTPEMVAEGVKVLRESGLLTHESMADSVVVKRIIEAAILRARDATEVK